MKTRFILASAVIALATSGVVFGQAAGGGGAGGGGAAGGAGRGGAGGAGGGAGRFGGFMRGINGGNQYDEMVKAVASLSDDQKTKLKEKCDAMIKELEKFNEDSRSRFNPGAGGDGGNMREQFQKLVDDRQKLVAELQGPINAVLTAEQRAEWETYKLNRDVTNRLSRAELTEDQKTKIQGLAKDAGKSISELKDPKDTKSVNAETGKLWKAVLALLTDDQAGKLMAPPMQMGMMGMGGGGGFGGRGMGAGGAGGTGGTGGRGGAGGGTGGQGGGRGGRGGRGGPGGGANGGGGNLP